MARETGLDLKTVARYRQETGTLPDEATLDLIRKTVVETQAMVSTRHTLRIIRAAGFRDSVRTVQEALARLRTEYFIAAVDPASLTLIRAELRKNP